jgi:hypothetical protein
VSSPAVTPAAPAQTSEVSWLAQRRLKIAVIIAVAEGVLVALDAGFSRWTVIIVAAPIIAFYLFAGRALESELGRQLAWIAAASQAFAVILVILAFVLKLFVWIIVGVLAVVALFLILGDKSVKR